MRIAVTLDDDLLEAAGNAIGVSERATVLREGLKALVEALSRIIASRLCARPFPFLNCFTQRIE